MPLLQPTLKAEILKITSPTPPATFPSNNEEVATVWSTAIGNYFKQAANPPGAAATTILAQAAFKVAMKVQLDAATTQGDPTLAATALDSGLLAFVTVPGLNAPPAIVPPPVPPVVEIWIATQIANPSGVTADSAADTLSTAMDLWFRTGTTVGGIPWS